MNDSHGSTSTRHRCRSTNEIYTTPGNTKETRELSCFVEVVVDGRKLLSRRRWVPCGGMAFLADTGEMPGLTLLEVIKVMKLKHTAMMLVCAGAVLGGHAALAAPPPGEENELSPEYLDTHFSAEDEKRMMAGFSDEILPDPAPNVVKQLAERADLVFFGRVLDQNYVYDEKGVPSTHTRFSVDEVLKGEYPQSELVLVQLGGPSASGDGGVLSSESSYFNVGEEELLFLKRRQAAATATDARGGYEIRNRFRVLDGKLFNDDGYAVIMNDAGGLGLSRDRHPDERFSTINMGTHKLYKQFSERSRGDGDSGGEAQPNAPETLMPTYANAVELSRFSAMMHK